MKRFLNEETISEMKINKHRLPMAYSGLTTQARWFMLGFASAIFFILLVIK